MMRCVCFPRGQHRVADEAVQYSRLTSTDIAECDGVRKVKGQREAVRRMDSES
jgi:hypothetical protein